jgi:hypothetical protein
MSLACFFLRILQDLAQEKLPLSSFLGLLHQTKSTQAQPHWDSLGDLGSKEDDLSVLSNEQKGNKLKLQKGLSIKCSKV